MSSGMSPADNLTLPTANKFQNFGSSPKSVEELARSELDFERNGRARECSGNGQQELAEFARRGPLVPLNAGDDGDSRCIGISLPPRDHPESKFATDKTQMKHG